MEDFKRVKFSHQNRAGVMDEFSVMVKVSANGHFYAHLPEKLKAALDEREYDVYRRGKQRRGFIIMSSVTLDELLGKIRKAHASILEPTVKKENVIRYNIESHVSFALTKDGEIFPNAGFPGAEWPITEEKCYGGHHACNRAQGGYSLTVGAVAVTKITTSYGDQSTVRYESYYKDGDHLGRENPAHLLNSWVSFDLPEDAREMPYSDEAAMFFFGLMKSIAELNRRIQEFTNTPDKIAAVIAEHTPLLLTMVNDRADSEKED